MGVLLRLVTRTRGGRTGEASVRRRRSFTLRRRLPPWVERLRPPRRSRLLLAEMRAFRGCSRSQIARIARWGDVAEAAPGDVLVREEHTDFWFFAILHGSVRVTQKGREVAVLGRGDHVGEVAIIGFGPQPATVTATEPTLLFVLGRRFLLSLAATDRAVQQALFPHVAAQDYRAHVRTMHQAGLAYWDRLAPRQRLSTRKDIERVAAASRAQRPGRSLSWVDALDILARHDLNGAPATMAPAEPPRTSRATRIAAAAAVVVALVAAAVFYHPPIAVITTGRVADVVGDIAVRGVRTHPSSGTYLLMTVNVHRPTLGGIAIGRARGRLLVRASSPDARQLDPAAAQRLAHQAFIDSHRLAIEVSERMLGVDADRATIDVRDRGVTGPSAGLLYGLAITDLLAPDDLAAGRAVAATGKLERDGTVSAVAFVSLKAKAAAAAGADLLLVPEGQGEEARGAGIEVVEVTSLKDAVEALKAPG